MMARLLDDKELRLLVKCLTQGNAYFIIEFYRRNETVSSIIFFFFFIKSARPSETKSTDDPAVADH